MKETFYPYGLYQPEERQWDPNESLYLRPRNRSLTDPNLRHLIKYVLTKFILTDVE